MLSVQCNVKQRQLLQTITLDFLKQSNLIPPNGKMTPELHSIPAEATFFGLKLIQRDEVCRVRIQRINI
jgi:hypothetical protein